MLGYYFITVAIIIIVVVIINFVIIRAVIIFITISIFVNSFVGDNFLLKVSYLKYDRNGR